MRNPKLFGRHGLCGAEIEKAIDLEGVAVDDFSIQCFGKVESKFGLSGSRGTGDGQQRGCLGFAHPTPV
jgi:hypothetical protein